MATAGIVIQNERLALSSFHVASFNQFVFCYNERQSEVKRGKLVHLLRITCILIFLIFTLIITFLIFSTLTAIIILIKTNQTQNVESTAPFCCYRIPPLLLIQNGLYSMIPLHLSLTRFSQIQQHQYNHISRKRL